MDVIGGAGGVDFGAGGGGGGGGVCFGAACFGDVIRAGGGGSSTVLTTGFVPASGAIAVAPSGLNTGRLASGFAAGASKELSNPVNSTVRRSPLILATSNVALSVPSTAGMKETPIWHVSFGWMVFPTQLFRGNGTLPPRLAA